MNHEFHTLPRRQSAPLYASQLASADVLFQQDGATCHTARIVRRWMDRHNIHLLPWPAKSADLSPIENLWSYLAREVEKEHAKTVPQLKAIAQAWQGLPRELHVTIWVATHAGARRDR